MMVMRGFGLGWSAGPEICTYTGLPLCSRMTGSYTPWVDCTPDEACVPTPDPDVTKGAQGLKHVVGKVAQANAIVSSGVKMTAIPPAATAPGAGGMVPGIIPVSPTQPAPSGYVAVGAKAYPTWWFWVGGIAAAFLGYKYFIAKPKAA